MWTKEETDQLFDLCERFDLRFVVIADKFPSSRTVEELKNRYYSGNLPILCYLLLMSDHHLLQVIDSYHISLVDIVIFDHILTVLCLFFVFCLASRAILVARAASPADVSGHPLVKVSLQTCSLCAFTFGFSIFKIPSA